MASNAKILAETQLGGDTTHTGSLDIAVGTTAQTYLHHLGKLE